MPAGRAHVSVISHNKLHVMLDSTRAGAITLLNSCKQAAHWARLARQSSIHSSATDCVISDVSPAARVLHSLRPALMWPRPG
jgi:hypothetical protein